MKKTLIFLCFALSATGAAAQVDGGGISDSMMERIRKGYTATPEQKAVIDLDRYAGHKFGQFGHV